MGSSDIFNVRSALVFRVKVSEKSLKVALSLEKLGNVYTMTECNIFKNSNHL
jgi:hypothetical protein